MEKNRISLKICGKQYPIKGDEPIEYLFNVGTYVDKTIDDVAKNMPYLSTEQAAVIASLNIADELFKLRKTLGAEWAGAGTPNTENTLNTAKMFAAKQ